jgi:CheY-like chemotaxis protein
MSLKTTPDVPVVAVFNASEDTVDFLSIFLEQQGFRAVGRTWPALEPLDRDVVRAFMSQHRPQVMVFDVSFPYELNWQRFREFQQFGDECHIPVVLTTTNERGLNEWTGATGVLEILGKPYDLEQLLQAVRRALLST